MLICSIIWSFLLTPIVDLTNNFNQLLGECKNGQYCNKNQNYQKFEKYETGNIGNPNIQDILSKIQRNWEAPSAYLKKRGYLTHDIPETSFEGGKNDENMDTRKRFLYFPNTQLEKRKICSQGNCDENVNGDLEIPQIMLTAIQSDNASEKKPNVITKLKNKIDGWFQPGKQSAPLNNTSTSVEEMNKKSSDYETASSGSTSDISDILRNMTRADIDYVKSFLKCYKENKSKFSINYTQINETALEVTTKPNKDILSSTQTMVTVNKINKNNRITTLDPETKKHNVSSSISTKSFESKVSSSSNTSTPSPVKMEGDVKLDIEIKSNDTEFGTTCACPTTSSAPIKKLSNETSHFPDELVGDDKTNANSNERSFSNLLKFLAHQHHFVDEVGKLPYKPLNLSKIQEMIDSAHEILAARAIIGDDDNSTDCTPIRLDKVDLELEWTSGQNPIEIAGQSTTQGPFREGSQKLSNMDDMSPKAVDEILLDYMSGNPESPNVLLEPPYSDNYLLTNNMDYENLLQVNSAEDLLPNILHKRDTQLKSPHAPSQIDTGRAFSFEDYLDDYIFENSREKKNSGSDDDDDLNSEQDSEFFGRKKKRKHRKRKKKKRKKYDNNLDHAEFAAECETLVSPRKEVDKGSQNDFKAFPELSDIQFHVNPDQQESIDKFIKNLNDPPEIFNFDVNQFMKPKSNYQSVQLETTPPKTFYEFLQPPPIENESVPVIAPEPNEFQLLTESGTSLTTEESKSVFNKRDVDQQYVKGDQPEKTAAEKTCPDSNMKRDLLRQYIKGVSQYIRAPDKPVEINSQPKPLTSDNNDLVDTYEDPLPLNYANELDAPKYDLSGSKIELPNDVGSDEFVDKFYLLNDGSFSIYGADKSVDKQFPKTYKDPVSLDIDLDLDKKFKELNFVEPMRKNVVQDTRNKIAELTGSKTKNFNSPAMMGSVFHKEKTDDK